MFVNKIMKILDRKYLMNPCCDICTLQKIVYSYCCNCSLHLCKSCSEYGQSIKTMSNADTFCSLVCTYNWINSKHKLAVSYVMEQCLDHVNYIAPFKKVQETYMDLYWSNNAAKICNEFLIDDGCLVVREYLN